MPLPAERSESTDKPNASLEVMVVDEWLIFDCPECSQTIKLDRKDSVHEIECPSCQRGFEPLLDREVKLPPLKGPSRKRARRRGPRSQRADGAEEPEEKPKANKKRVGRPTSSSLPTEGTVKLTLTPMEAEEGAEEIDTTGLPVRSATELERRRVESLDGQDHRQPDESELNAVIEEQSGGKYKRIRVRTRKKRLTEKQRATRLYLFGGLAGLVVVILSVWGASQFYKDDLEGDEDTSELAEVYADAEPIGAKLGHYSILINELKQATTVDQLLKLIRMPKRLEPTLRSYYGERGVPAPTVRDVLQTAGRFQGKLPKDFSRFQLLLPTSEIPLYMEKTKEYGFRLDWESYIGLGSIPWEVFIETKVMRNARMRVYASDATYFEGKFTKERHYCLRIVDPTREHTLYGYYERNNPKLTGLTEFMFTASSKRSASDINEVEVPITLDIRFPAAATNNVQVEIVDFPNDTWLKP